MKKIFIFILFSFLISAILVLQKNQDALMVIVTMALALGHTQIKQLM